MKNKIHLIWLRSPGRLLISKRKYSSWREIQDEYEDYMTSISYPNVSSILEFIRDDWVLSDEDLSYYRKKIEMFMNSDNIVRS